MAAQFIPTTRYFKQCQPAMHRRVAKLVGWVDDEELPITQIDPRVCVATSQRLDVATLDAVRSSKNVAHDNVPLLVEHRGTLYVVDGHHRLASALRRRARRVRVRIISK